MTEEKEIIQIHTPDQMDVETSLRDALHELHPDAEMPGQELFALDGLGLEPQLQYPLNGYVGDVDKE
jgi:hypothetical protein